MNIIILTTISMVMKIMENIVTWKLRSTLINGLVNIHTILGAVEPIPTHKVI